MHIHSLKALAIVAAVAGTATGCTTTERTVGGAVIGGTGGAILGNAIGGSGGAVVGAVAGGSVGAVVGNDSGRRRY